MADIVQRLRRSAKFGGHYAEAANEIERLRRLLSNVIQVFGDEDGEAAHCVITDIEDALNTAPTSPIATEPK